MCSSVDPIHGPKRERERGREREIDKYVLKERVLSQNEKLL